MKFALIVVIISLLLTLCHVHRIGHNMILSYLMRIRRRIVYRNSYLLSNFDVVFSRNHSIRSIQGPAAVNVHNDAKNQYALLGMAQYIPAVEGIQRRESLEENMRILMSEVLRHVHVDGRLLGIEDVAVLNVLSFPGSYFPVIHTDIDFGAFPVSHGFNVWYLMSNPNPTGNMFILDTPQVEPHSYLEVLADKTLIVSQCNLKILREADPSIRTDGLSYIDADAGDCLIFGKTVYHMSDPRVEAHGDSRLAVNLRVLVREPDGGITVDLTENCAYNSNLRDRMAIAAGTDVFRIFPSLTELAKLF